MMKNKVSIWTGHFSDNDKLKEYTKERYTDEADMDSLFMNGYKIDFIDNQFQEVLFLNENVTRQTLIAPLSYSEFFIGKINLKPGHNAVIAIYNFEYSGKILRDGRSQFLGVYDYNDD